MTLILNILYYSLWKNYALLKPLKEAAFEHLMLPEAWIFYSLMVRLMLTVDSELQNFI